MAPYQLPKVVNLTLDKQKIFDYVKLLFEDPEKCDLDVDELLKTAAVGEVRPMELGSGKGNDWENKVLLLLLLVLVNISKIHKLKICNL